MSFITKAQERGRQITAKLESYDMPTQTPTQNNTQTPSNKPNTPNNPNVCGVVCQKKKKRKILLIGLGVLVIGGVAFFVLKKK
jgi:hypothetical protein